MDARKRKAAPKKAYLLRLQSSGTESDSPSSVPDIQQATLDILTQPAPKQQRVDSLSAISLPDDLRLSFSEVDDGSLQLDDLDFNYSPSVGLTPDSSREDRDKNDTMASAISSTSESSNKIQSANDRNGMKVGFGSGNQDVYDYENLSNMYNSSDLNSLDRERNHEVRMVRQHVTGSKSSASNRAVKNGITVSQSEWTKATNSQDPQVSTVGSSGEAIQKKKQSSPRRMSKNKHLVNVSCQVCGDVAAGFYCGAYICEACKKFYMRAYKQDKLKYVCLRDKQCVITKESRVQCQYCRFQKCVALNMYCPKQGEGESNKEMQMSEIPCRVCSAPSSGFHFGAITCEGCKGFFRRMAKEREPEKYQCNKKGSCEINMITRNLCKACRYKQCIKAGMSVEGSRIGRQPNSVKHAITLELKNQVKIEPSAGNESSCQEVLNTSLSIKEEPVEYTEMKGVSGDSPLAIADDILQWEDWPKSDADTSQSSLSIPAVNETFTSLMTTSDSVGSLQSHQEVSPRLSESWSGSAGPTVSSWTPASTSSSHWTVSSTSETLLSSGHSLPLMPASSYNSSIATTQSYNQMPTATVSHYTSPQVSPTRKMATPVPPIATTQSYNQMPTATVSHYTSPQVSPTRKMATPVPPMATTQSYNQMPSATVSQYTSPQVSPTRKMATPVPTMATSQSYHQMTSGTVSQYTSPQVSPTRKMATPVPTMATSMSYHQMTSGTVSQYTSPQVSPTRKTVTPTPSIPQAELAYPFPSHSLPSYRTHPPPVYTSVSNSTLQPHYTTAPNPRKTEQPETEHWQASQPALTNAGHQFSTGFQTPSVSPQLSPTSKAPVMKTSLIPGPKIKILIPNHEHNFLLPSLAKDKFDERMNEFIERMIEAGKVLQLLNYRVFDTDIKPVSSMDVDQITALFETKFMDPKAGNQISSSVDISMFSTRENTWNFMMLNFHHNTYITIRFAKMVPGFKSLSLNDQVKLIQSSIYPIELLNMSKVFDPATKRYNYFTYTLEEKQIMMEQFPMLRVFQEHFLHIGEMVTSFNLNDEEIAMLSALLLFPAEVHGLENPTAVEELQSEISLALQYYEERQFADGLTRYGVLLVRVAELVQCLLQHNLAIGLLLTHNPSIKVPQLFHELIIEGIREGHPKTGGGK